MAELGFDNILILNGYRREDFYPIIGPWAEEFGVAISLSEETTPLGTGGALRNALQKLEDNFLLLNGDTWFGFDWRKLRDGGNNVLRMALFEHRGDGRYGNADLRDGKVSFNAGSDERDRYLANGGVYWLAKSLVNEFPSESPLSLENDVFPILSERGLIEGKVFSDLFIDIGVPQDYARAELALAGLK